MKRSADPNSDKMRAEFRQKLENYQSAPSSKLWDEIELSLDKEEALVYKNRFRTYSRLAAACLLLLLAFSVIFIPNKLQQFKGENAEIAATQNQETRQAAGPAEQLNGGNSSAETAQIKPENAASEMVNAQPEKASENATVSGKKTAQNGIISAGKTAKNGMVYSGKTGEFHSEKNPENVTRQTAEIPVTAKTETENAVAFENASPEKTVAFNAPKVTPNVLQPASAQASENAIPQAAKTARAARQTSENPNPDEMQNPTAETDRAAISLADTKAPEPAFEPKITNPEITTAAPSEKETTENRAVTFSKESASSQVPEPALARTFSGENHSVSLKKAPFKPLPFLKLQPTELLKTDSGKFVLSDSTMLATLPETQELTGISTLAEKKPAKNRKWQVAVAYAARGFQPGMQLANQVTIQPSMISNTAYQEQQLQEYKTAIEEFNQNTRSGFSQGGALKFGFKLSKNWQLQSGVTYFNYRAQTTSQYAFSNAAKSDPVANPSLAANPGMVESTLLTVLENSFMPGRTHILKTEAAKTGYAFEQIGVPLNLRFQTVAPKLYYFGAAGFSINLVKAVTVTHEEEKYTFTPVTESTRLRALSSTYDPYLFRKWLPAVGLQAGAGYHLSECWHLELGLEGEQFLKPLIQSEDRAGAKQKNPVSLGASLQMGFSF